MSCQSNVVNTIKIDEKHVLYPLLLTVDRDLAYFPQRAFTFGEFEILVNQSIDHVGSTVWDAELLLSHFLYDAKSTDGLSINGASVLELGAGTAIAGILCDKLGAKCVTLQELEEVVQHTQCCCETNDVRHTTVCLAKEWGGNDCIDALLLTNKGEYFDLIIMADVLYHCTDFLHLVQTILGCSRTSSLQLNGNGGTDIIICFEKRRADLRDFFELFERQAENVSVSLVQVYRYSVIGPIGVDDKSSAEVNFYIYHYKL